MKKLLIIGITILLTAVLNGCMDESLPVSSKIIYVDEDGGRDYTSIQEAIDNADDGDIIYVENGSYHETLLITKSINLIGYSTDKTIIVFNESRNTNSNIVFVDKGNCIIKNFKIINTNESVNTIGINVNSSNNIISNNTILNNKQGIWINKESRYNNISYNNLSNNTYGLVLEKTNTNIISFNNISSSIKYVIYIWFGSELNTISNNIISNNDYGVRVQSSNNTIYGNLIENNQRGLYFCCGASGNIIFLNVLRQNIEYNAGDGLLNQWDNGYIGNYWDDFDETSEGANDNNGDGIIDTTYTILGGDNQDRFPLMYPPLS